MYRIIMLTSNGLNYYANILQEPGGNPRGPGRVGGHLPGRLDPDDPPHVPPLPRSRQGT